MCPGQVNHYPFRVRLNSPLLSNRTTSPFLSSRSTVTLLSFTTVTFCQAVPPCPRPSCQPVPSFRTSPATYFLRTTSFFAFLIVFILVFLSVSIVGSCCGKVNGLSPFGLEDLDHVRSERSESPKSKSHTIVHEFPRSLSHSKNSPLLYPHVAIKEPSKEPLRGPVYIGHFLSV